VTSKIWRHLPYEGTALIVMLALGDFADDDGNAFPHFAKLAQKARCSTKTVQRTIAKAEQDGYVIVDRSRGRESKTFYRIVVEKLSSNTPASVDKLSMDSSPICGHLVPDLWTSRPRSVDICDLAYKEEQSENSQRTVREPVGAEAPAPLPLRGKNNAEDLQAVNEIWDHYIEAMGRNPSLCRLTPLRIKKGLARLNECRQMVEGRDPDRAVELMNLAIDRMADSDWHMGRNPKTGGKKYNEWEEQLFGSTERLEKWLQD